MTPQPLDRSGGDDQRSAFAVRLDALFTAAGNPPAKSVLRIANTRLREGARPITAQRVSDWRRGHRTPATFESVLPLLEVLIPEARRRAAHDSSTDTSLFDPKRWQADWRAARTEPLIFDTNREPYRGPAPYRFEDAELFFGRRDAEAQLLQLLSDVEASGSPKLLLLLGSQGIGKTSLVAAGLRPAVESGRVLTLTPGADPVAALTTTLAAVRRGPRLLIVDQGEELFTVCSNEQLRQRFLSELETLATPDADPPTTVIVTLDIAYLPELPHYPPLATALQHRAMTLNPMSEQQLREAIIRPAAAVGLRVEDTLAEVLLQDVASLDPHHPSRLSLLSSVLSIVWERRRGRTLTLASYREIGSLPGIMTHRAERWWSQLSDQEKHAARTVLLALTTIGPTAAHRNRMPRETLIEEADDPQTTSTVIDRLLDVRILVRHNNELELAHDLALTVWPRMAEWITEEREFAPARQRIETDAREWARQNRPAALLYTRTRLEDAAELMRRTDSPNRLAHEFVTESLTQATIRTRRRRALWATVALLTVLALVLSVLTIAQRTAAGQQRKDAWLGQVVATSQRLEDSDPATSTALALSAYRMNPRHPSARARLMATQTLPTEIVSPADQGAPIEDLATGPARGLAATAGEDGRIRLWNINDRGAITSYGPGADGHRGPATAVAFTPDGAQVLSAGQDGTIRLWDVHDPRAARQLASYDNGSAATALAMLPGGRAAVSSADGTLTFLDITGRQAITRITSPITAHAAAVRALAVAPDTPVLASAGEDGTIRLWSFADADHPAPLGAPLDGRAAVGAIEFGADGVLAAGTADGSLRIWDVRDPARPRLTSEQHARRAAISGLTFGFGGQLLGVTRTDGTMQLWITRDVDRVNPLGWEIHGNSGSIRAVRMLPPDRMITTGSDGRVRAWTPPPGFLPILVDGTPADVGFDRDGHDLAIGLSDGRVETWDVTTPRLSHLANTVVAGAPDRLGARVALRPDGRLLAATTGAQVRLWDLTVVDRPVDLGTLPGDAPFAFSPDGNRLLTSAPDHALQVWDISSPQHPRPIQALRPGSDRDVSVAMFSPDGSRIAAADDGNRILLWNTDDRNATAPTASVDTAEHSLHALAFTPDGRTLVSGGASGTISSWDITDPSHIRPLDTVRGHTARITTLVIDHSGRRLGSAGDDRTANLWDISDPGHIRQADVPLTLPIGTSWYLRFDPREETIALAVGDQGAVRGYLDPDAVATSLCTTHDAGIDTHTWHELLPSVPYTAPCP
ncbi:nSTAND1 domain-containing NTPase [Nocardia pseudobrasiliensis]|uniref:nSTAND1 domain-containing NTPase n=1 Tax=Nocardia pseudobrasiliensis TaxID=45979 RepID=UPI0014716282|nr:AAA family ATPase [Nocardia pseudobrasiliensis]